ncbi:MAG TPA: type II toxin-antitoxin system HicB family antitoxin [Pararobbsia sp.]|nr:type II toxin-antitoxin system HicB family antitoxin [Pararobbsia sp.]
MYAYPIKIKPDDNGTLLVTFPDIPEAITVAESEEDVGRMALEALESAFDIYFDQRREIPAPSAPKRGQKTVTLSALVTSKVLLANEMVRQGVRKAELARRLRVHSPQVDRLLDPRHSSKIDAIESAFESLGRRLDISVA